MKAAFILATTFALLLGCDQRNSVAYGTLERERVVHLATQSEIVTELPIPAGQEVVEGDVLVALDSRSQQASLDGAIAEVHRAIANLQKLRNGARPEEVAQAQAQVRQAQSKVTETESNYNRLSNLVDQDMASQAQLDQVTASRDAAIAMLEQAQEALRELTNGTRPEDLMMAEAELQRAEAMQRLEQKKLDDLTITASRSGVLETLPWNLGERVATGSPVAVVLAGESPFARVYLPQPYRVHVRTGMRLTLTIDGYNEPIEGTVRWVSDDAAYTPYYALSPQDRSRLVYLVEIQLEPRFNDLPSGIPVQVPLAQLDTDS